VLVRVPLFVRVQVLVMLLVLVLALGERSVLVRVPVFV
jgi:hypothetical protein